MPEKAVVTTIASRPLRTHNRSETVITTNAHAKNSQTKILWCKTPGGFHSFLGMSFLIIATMSCLESNPGILILVWKTGVHVNDKCNSPTHVRIPSTVAVRIPGEGALMTKWKMRRAGIAWNHMEGTGTEDEGTRSQVSRQVESIITDLRTERN